MILIYSKNNCVPCNYIKALFENNGVKFEERNISNNPKFVDEVKELGFQSVPLVVKDNKVIANGLQMDKLLPLLEENE